ncbi:MAG TPA: DUF1206 domain-containing protein [Flavitalea sp.]|nr:DUF1206 domain-containing protein [Flavitalea sp.]
MLKSIGARSISPIAQTGLTAKGIVYCIMGLLAFMSAFELNGQRNEDADKKGAFEFIQKQTGGQIMLGIIAVGLLCYCSWRFYETFRKKTADGKEKTPAKKFRYLFSGLIYLSLAFYAGKMLFQYKKNNQDSTQQQVAQLLEKPFGQWLVAGFGLIIAAVGVYQAYYGLSEKYKKHVQKLNLHAKNTRYLLASGKIGYVSRGIVWLIISWLLLKASIHANSKEAGDTGKAFGFLESSPFGSYLLAALGLGLVCYGFFNFIRARYEKF